MALNTISGGAFQDCEGSPLASGYLVCELSHDEQETSTTPHGQVVGGLKRTIILDNNGNAATGSQLWANDVMSPANSYYIVNAYRQDGTLAWKAPQYWQIASSPTPFDLGSLVPANPPGSGLGSFSSITLQTNEVNNGSQTLLDLHAGTNMTLTDNGSGRVTFVASGGASFATSGQGFFFGLQDVQPIADVGSPGAIIATTTVIGVAQLNLPYSIKISNASLFVITDPGVASVTYAAIYSADGNTKLVDVVGGFNLNTGSQVVKNVAIAPVTLNPGSYLFACGNVNGSAAFGTVAGHQPYNAYFINSLLNANTARVGRATNAISGGAMPATLGTITAFTHTDNSLGLPAVMFQA